MRRTSAPFFPPSAGDTYIHNHVLQILIRIMEFFCAIDVDNLNGFYKSMLPLARVHNQRNIRYGQIFTGWRDESTMEG